jgi:excisionase family DNA binding protein
MKMATEIMTLSELADYLRVHRSTIYRQMKAEDPIPHFMMGSDYRFMKVAVDEWIQKRHKETASA